MRSRKRTRAEIQDRILDRSRRRCALCVHFKDDYGQKEGQIAHIDRNPANADEDNLVYLCLPHHDDYDTTRRQTKNLTPREVKTARDRLYDFIERGGDLGRGPQRPTGMEADWKTLDEIQALMATVPDYFLNQPNFGGSSFSMHEIEAFRAVVEKRNKPEHEFIDPELEELRWNFISEGLVLLGVMDNRLVRAPQQGWFSLPIEWRSSAPERLERVATILDAQAAKTGLAYHTLIRAARRKLES
jgi:hypothetical protein